LCNRLPVQDFMKKRNALSSLFFNFASESPRISGMSGVKQDTSASGLCLYC